MECRDERRSSRRYPIQIDLEYSLIRGQRVMGTGQGRTLNFSSDGVLFESDVALPLGTGIELSIQWPVLLRGQVGLALHATGRIVRAEGNRTAVRIDHHDFRIWPRRRAG